MRRALASLSPIALILSLAACGAARDYPSLERRSAERVTGSARPVAPESPAPPPAAASADLTTRLAQLVDHARSAHQRFSARRAGAERVVAAGGASPLGSEGWATATVALSDLESSRSDAMIALAELDQLYAGEVVAAAQTGEVASVEAIAAAREQVTGLVAEEDRVLADLRGRMRG